MMVLAAPVSWQVANEQKRKRRRQDGGRFDGRLSLILSAEWLPSRLLVLH